MVVVYSSLQLPEVVAGGSAGLLEVLAEGALNIGEPDVKGFLWGPWFPCSIVATISNNDLQWTG